MKQNFSFIHIIVLSFFAWMTPSFAANWSNTDISFLAGNTYRAPGAPDTDVSKNILTLEHASGWEYGDNYFFTDVSGFNSSTSSIYTEWAPRLSMGKIFKKEFNSIIKDISLAGQYNFSSGSKRYELYGAGVDLNIPYFNFLKVNIYLRDDKAIDGETYQVTVAWAADFNLGVPLRFTGFFDYAGEEGSGSSVLQSNFLAQPQLMWMARKNLGVGIEYQYWKNKFGIKDLDESAPQILVRWTL